MKLSEFKGEEAIEVLADLIEPASKIMSDTKIREMVKSKISDIKLVQHMLKEHSKPVLDMYCILNKTTAETATPITLTKAVLEMLNDEELKSLFTSQAQSMENGVSTPVTEITQADEQ